MRPKHVYDRKHKLYCFIIHVTVFCSNSIIVWSDNVFFFYIEILSSWFRCIQNPQTWTFQRSSVCCETYGSLQYEVSLSIKFNVMLLESYWHLMSSAADDIFSFNWFSLASWKSFCFFAILSMKKLPQNV